MSFECWIFSHGSDLIASQLLLEIAHWIPLSPQSVSSHLISTHLISRLVIFFYLTSSHPISCLLSLAQFFSAGQNCSLLFSCHLSFSRLFSSHLSLSQPFSIFHRSSQLFSALRGSCQLIWCLLISSLLFSHFLSSSHISSADLSSCQLVSPHLSPSQRTLKSYQLFSGPKRAPNKDLGAKASDPYAFHREDLTQRTFILYTHNKLLYREACTHRSFFTETGKLLHRDREAFARWKLLRRASRSPFRRMKNWHPNWATASMRLVVVAESKIPLCQSVTFEIELNWRIY